MDENGLFGFAGRLGDAAVKYASVLLRGLIFPFAVLFRLLKKPAAAVAGFVVGLFAPEGKSGRETASEMVRTAKDTVRHPAEISSSVRKKIKDSREAGTRGGSFILRLIPLLAAVLLICTIVHYASSRVAIRIEADGSLLGYVSSESDFRTACAAAEERLSYGGGSFRGELPDVTYRLEVVDIGSCVSSAELSERLLENTTEGLVSACGVYVGEKFLGAARSESEARNVFADVLQKAETDSDETTAFAEDIRYVPGLYPDTSDCIKRPAQLRAAAEKLPLRVTRTEITNEPVGFGAVEIPSRTLSVNTARTILEGVNGTDQVTKLVTYINGRAVSSKEVGRITVDPPIAVHRLIGTKLYGFYTPVITASSVELLWPVDGAYNINSDYSYRWGSFHYGLDIGVGSAPGTSLGKNVLAAADGVVELATTHSSYGYYIILDHGNGMETVYGHLYENSFMVRPGERVTRGQPIARVGQTGYATGPHLHFEVRVNGNKVDPKLYLQQYKGIGY